MKSALFALLLLSSFAAVADPAQRLTQLEAAFNRLQQEQQSVYQQFLMAQEQLRNERYETSPGMTRNNAVVGVESGQIVDYDENRRVQREREQRLERYTRDLNQAYSRYLELGQQKKLLLDQMLELAPTEKR